MYSYSVLMTATANMMTVMIMMIILLLHIRLAIHVMTHNLHFRLRVQSFALLIVTMTKATIKPITNILVIHLLVLHLHNILLTHAQH